MLKTLTEWILAATADLPPEAMRIEGAWLLNINYQPSANERLFQYDVALIQVQAAGAAYSAYDSLDKSQLHSLVGNDARKMITGEYSPVNIALLDAMFASLSPLADEKFLISGKDKAGQRADIVCGEALNLRRKKLIPEKAKVVNVGAIGNIIEKLAAQGFAVTASDLDKGIIGKELGGVRIVDGAKHTNELVAEADLAVVTGMCISNGSLPEIIDVAKKNNTRVLIVGETGAGFGRAYCDLFDIDVVVAEPYPFYIFNCYSELLIYRKGN